MSKSVRGAASVRLRRQLERSVSSSVRSCADVAREYGVSDWSAHQALAVAGQVPPPVTRLGLDETRTRRVRWYRDGVVPHEPVDDELRGPRHRPPRLAARAGTRRSGAVVQAWLAAQPESWRDGIEVVTLDPSAPFAVAIRRVLPRATIVVDHWHLVRLANQMVTDVRQRVAREQLGRRGRTARPAWAHRTLLLRAGDRLSKRALAKLMTVLAADDPTNEIGAAWGCKEHLRQLLASSADRAEIRTRLWTFYQACAAADMPETTRLAGTIETWWPAIEAFLLIKITNARTEGSNRTIKQIKRVSVSRPSASGLAAAA